MASRLLIAASLSLFLLCLENAHADLVIMRGYKPGQTATTQPGAPRGLFEFLNGPLRLGGWTIMGTDAPIGYRLFTLKVTNDADAATLIKRFSQIDAPLRLELDPRASAPQDIIPVAGADAVFIQSSQSEVEAFMARYAALLPSVGQTQMNGRDKWVGYFAAGAQPPKTSVFTLRLYVGNGRIDLSKLDVPANVEVGGPTQSFVVFDPAWRYQPSPGELEMMKQIEEFIAAREKKRQSAPASLPAIPESR